MEYTVTHLINANRFEIFLEMGLTAYLDYIKTDQGWNFAHTYVPKAYEGRGIAAVIVQFGLDYAMSRNIHVIPSCPYVSAYIERHPQYKILV